jgi:DNA-binding response OmpR family regulator
MIVFSRDAAWLSRLERIAQRGGWPFEAMAVAPSAGRVPSLGHTLALLDRALAGASPASAVTALRALYPAAAIVLAFDAGEMSHAAALAAVSCGCDDVLGKGWADGKLSPRLATLRDRFLAAQSRVSACGALKAERRAHRAHIKSGGRWNEVSLDAGGFALLWRLLEREGEPVSRTELAAALSSAAGRELELGTVARRVAALKKSLAPWSGSIESARGGLYRLVPCRKSIRR